MILDGPGHPYLTYCTNIHPGQTLDEVTLQIHTSVAAVKNQVSPDRPFGLGLRLSDEASKALELPGALDSFKSMLGKNDLYVFTLNGFPFGEFHDKPIKENAYRPNWADPARLTYTDRLARLLAELLPDDPHLIGSISTLPGGFRADIKNARQENQIASQIISHCAACIEIFNRTGKTIALAIEPEPFCLMETTKDAVDFFNRYLFSKTGIDRLALIAGLSKSRAEQAIHRHIGFCLDCCHSAVMFENPAKSLGLLKSAGIGLFKVQLSAGLTITDFSDDALSALRLFAEQVYFHQATIKAGETLSHFLDLSQALSMLDENRKVDELRIHFHVPIFLKDLPPFHNTQDHLVEIMELLKGETYNGHLEVETYSFNVLPEIYRTDDLVSAVSREVLWAKERMQP